MIELLLRAGTYGGLCALAAACVNALFGVRGIDPVSVWALVSAGFVVGAAEG